MRSAVVPVAGRLTGEMRDTAILSACVILSTLLYLVVYVNVPITLIPAGTHDDGLYIQHAQSIAAGQWLGPYSQFTLMKGSGYSIFLAFLSWFRFPTILAQALFYSFAVGLLSLLTLKLFRSRLLALAVFEVMLWNFGSDSNRVMREAIYHSQFLLSLSLLALALLCPNRFRTLLTVFSGIVLGWLWITREEGIIALPAFIFLFLYSGYLSYRSSSGYRPLLSLLTIFVVSSAAFPTGVALVNKIKYGEFVTVDFGGDFEGALEALESIQPDQRITYLSVSRDVREKAYHVSPTFARLRKLFDDPGVPEIVRWKSSGCQYFPQTCGDYAFGWFMWAFRDAAAVDGEYASASKTATFFRKIHDEVKHACETKSLVCSHSVIPFMPQLNRDQFGALPTVLGQLLRRLLFIDAPWTENGASWGSIDAIQQDAGFLNVLNYLPAAGVAPSSSNISTIALSCRVKTLVIRLYSRFDPILIGAGFIAFLLYAGISVVSRNCTAGFVIAFVAWMTIVLRVLVLALIDVSSFPTIFNPYLSLAFPLSCFAALLSLFAVSDAAGNYIWPKVGRSLMLSRIRRHQGLPDFSGDEALTLGNDS